jgi:hypothetical protein
MQPLRVLAITACVLIGSACTRAVYESFVTETLPEDQSYVWGLRAWHADELWVPVGDSLDLALLRDRCGVPAGHGLTGCYAEEDSTVRPQWRIADRHHATLQPLGRGTWRFGPASAGARVHGRSAGVTVVTVRLPQGVLTDTIRVLPRFDRLRIEPRESSYVTGDTIWFRVMGLDSAGRQVTSLPWPLWGRQVGSPLHGAVPIVFDDVTHPSLPTPAIVVWIGTKADTLRFRVLPRKAASG